MCTPLSSGFWESLQFLPLLVPDSAAVHCQKTFIRGTDTVIICTQRFLRQHPIGRGKGPAEVYANTAGFRTFRWASTTNTAPPTLFLPCQVDKMEADMAAILEEMEELDQILAA